jgi:hypothetical protein
MKLGCSYGVFSGLELLKPSLLNIRPFAEHIVVVWSPVSSSGDPGPAYAKPLLDSLVREGLVDELFEFVPKRTIRPIEMQDNCRIKREIGRIRCQLVGCSHHLVRDCDEFHNPILFRGRMEAFERNDVTLTPIVEYVQKPMIRIKGISKLYVPCVHRIGCQLKRHNPFGVTVDMGRTVCPVKSFRIFAENELVLHHYTSVRINEAELQRKYQGHGHLNRVGTLNDFVNKVYGYGPDELEEVPDTFGIQDYWKGEFQQWLS